MSKKRRRYIAQPSNRAWLSAHPQSAPSAVPRYVKPLEALLRCSNDFFTAGALWSRREGLWCCIAAAPCLRWMIAKDPASAKMELLRRGFSWSWVDRKNGKFSPATCNNDALNIAPDPSLTGTGSARSAAGPGDADRKILPGKTAVTPTREVASVTRPHGSRNGCTSSPGNLMLRSA